MASKITWIWVVRVLIALVAVGSLIATITFQSGDGTKQPGAVPTSPPPSLPSTIPSGSLVTIPDLFRADTFVARRILIDEGLVAFVGFLKDEQPGLWSVVFGQDPQPGEQLPPGEVVSLFVNKTERPDLDLPESPSGRCPVTPVHPSPRFRLAMTTEHTKLGSATDDGTIRLNDYSKTDAGSEVSLLWGTTAGYKGPLLVRGDRIDGDGELTFFQDPDPVDSRLISRGTPTEFHFDRGGAPNGFAWTTVVTFPKPGYYAFQIDEPTFTEHIVVEAL